MPKTKCDVIRMRHMLDAMLKVIRFIKGKERNELDTDEQLALALVRLVEITGEAANKVSLEVKERHPQIPWRDIIGTRNRLIHAYDEVNYEILWQIVSVDIPKLADELSKIIAIEERTEQEELF